MFSGLFWKDTFERVVVTFAEGYVASAVVLGGAILDQQSLKIAAGAAVISFFKAIAASKIGSKDSASLTV